MAEAGFAKGQDGFYASAAEGTHSPEVMGVAEGQEGQEAEDLSGEAAFSDAVEDTEAMESSSEIAQTDDFQFEDDAFAGDELAEAEPEPEPEPKKK